MTSFIDVCNEEWKEIQQGRADIKKAEKEAAEANKNAHQVANMVTPTKVDEASENIKPTNLVGLAFSGGGIRSATFNLGVIQALAELRLLRKFDYLSTVSGGGYIGSWLTSWMTSHDQTKPEETQNDPAEQDAHRDQVTQQKAKSLWNTLGSFISRINTPRYLEKRESKNIIKIEEMLAPDMNGIPTLAAGKDEPPALRHLRSYTDYLKPRGGLFSLDAMTAFTTWLRNTLLNQLILIAIFAAILMLPLALGWLVKYHDSPSIPEYTEINVLLWIAASACLAIAIGLINANIMFKPSIENPMLPWYSSKKWVGIGIVLPLAVGSILLSIMLPWLHELVVCAKDFSSFMGEPIQFRSWSITPAVMLWVLFALCGFAFFVSSPLRLAFFKESNRRDSSVLIYGLIFTIPTLLGMLLLLVIAKLLVPLSPEIEIKLAPAAVIANTLTFGPPLILSALALSIFIYIGIIGREFDEHQREWWSRLVALIIFTAIAWLALFGISIWGALVVDYLGIGLKSAIVWLGASGIGAAMGKSASISAKSESKGGDKWLAVAAQTAPYIFIFGLCLLVAYLLNVSLMRIIGDGEHYNNPYFTRLAQLNEVFTNPSDGITLAVGCIALFFIGILLSWRVDINVFSFHNFYRNRLTRAYLAAGVDPEDRENRKLPLTGMNDRDSPRLDRLPSRPYHLLNTALNITSGKHLSWQERKAASFFFSKKFCGYSLPEEEPKFHFCATNDYLKKLEGKGWLSLSLPMTISGAAASPNGGYHTSPPLAFLMTVFNARLGWWMQNTAIDEYWHSTGPLLGLKYLFKELGASVDESSPFVYLSDGGHFENLGIYELVRRNCRLIVACDAGADPKYEFEDLGNAIRKCYIDLGVRIDIDTSAIKPIQDGVNKGRSPQQSAIGRIHYPNGKEMGVLLYIKASMGNAEATDIEHYKAKHPDFPHDPTANQFFTESQFESYRKLGYTLCQRAFNNIEKESDTRIEVAKALSVLAQCLGRPYKLATTQPNKNKNYKSVKRPRTVFR